MNSRLLPKATREYIRKVEEKAAIIEVEWEDKLPTVILYTTRETVQQLPYLSLTTGEIHILIKSFVPISLYSLFNCLIENKAPIPTDVKGFCAICAKLIARGHLKLSYKESERPRQMNYTGTLTVNTDGTITFMPDDKNYQELVNLPLVTVISDATNLPPYIPVVVRAQQLKVYQKNGREGKKEN